MRKTLCFGNLFCSVSLVVFSLRNLGFACGQATVVNSCFMDGVFDVARSYVIGCLQACVHEC